MNFAKASIATITLTCVFACSHPLEPLGNGNITSASDNRDCTLEDYLDELDNCTKNTVIGDYNETYYAEPSPGWHFFGWKTYCAANDGNECSFNIPASVVQSFWGETMPPLQADFSEGTVFDWQNLSPDLTPVVDPTSFSLVVNGITATISAYVAQWNGQGYSIFGPFPVTNGALPSQPVGFVRWINNGDPRGLFFQAGSMGGISLSGEEPFSGGGGFDNGGYFGDDIPVFNFAVISFSQPVDLGEVSIGRLANRDCDFWLASSGTEPDLNQIFSDALGGYVETRHERDNNCLEPYAKGLAHQHSNLTHLLIGAPPTSIPDREDFPLIGNPDSFKDHFAILSVTVR